MKNESAYIVNNELLSDETLGEQENSNKEIVTEKNPTLPLSENTVFLDNSEFSLFSCEENNEEDLPPSEVSKNIAEKSPFSSETSEQAAISQDKEDPDKDSFAENIAMPETEGKGKQPIKPYSERAYLLYGNTLSAAELDLKGTKCFLKDFGFDGGELRQARLGKHFSERTDSKNLNGKRMICSYCGTEITGIDYTRLPDGRLRCNICSRTTVRSKEELTEIYQRVLYHLDALFGATISNTVSVEMLEERNLKKKLKQPLSQVDDKSILILGVAVNQKKEYSVYLENGLPRLSAIATFAHELTHVWQYTHWNAVKGLPKMSKKAKLLVYEGMAKWVEIQYLYLIGELAAAKREEDFTLKRNDEYGVGFRLYSEQYPLSKNTMFCNENPFRTDAYPIS